MRGAILDPYMSRLLELTIPQKFVIWLDIA